MSFSLTRSCTAGRNLPTLLGVACLLATGCMTPTDKSPIWDYSEISGNLHTLQTATEDAPKQAIAMVARELEESLNNHSRAASGEVADVLSSLASQVTEFRQAIPTETKQQLLERIKKMEQTLPSAPAAE